MLRERPYAVMWSCGHVVRAEAVQEYMRTEELTVRETAAALGVSPGRVQQYIKRRD